MPRPCVPPDACPVHFDLRVDHLSTDDLFQLVNPNSGKRPWYKFLSPNPQTGTPYLLTLQASGKLAANRLDIHDLAASRVSATVDLQQGKLRISDLTADILGGQHTGELRADFTGKVPEYTGSGSLNRIALRQLADAMHDYWISGTATMHYKINASGLSSTDLFASADGVLQIEAHDATLTHLTLPGNTVPLHVRSLTSRMALRGGVFEIQEGKLEAPGGIYQVSGKASLGRVLDVKLVRDGLHGFSVSGPLNDPKVTPAANAETQAALKP
jgi:hypothetical protein